jgi:dTDP-4-amino-4,6-dideoxygalactose transaminase
MNKPILISISPNTQKDDVILALKTLFSPWKWIYGKSQEKVSEYFEKNYQDYQVFLYNSGRSSLYAILKSFGIGKGDEVLIQAFSCVAVAEPIIWLGAKPVYSDIDSSLNIDPKKIIKKINKHTKAIIIQHTFGIPAQISNLRKIAQKYNLILIEDCAHSLGASYANRKVGSFGDAVFFSFGRDKVVSSVFGGAAMIKNKHKDEIELIKKINKDISFPPFFWIIQQLLHPIFFSFIKPLYNLQIGKGLIWILQKIKLLSKPIYKEEYYGGKPKVFPAKFPNALSIILFNQLLKLNGFNKKRQIIALRYHNNLKNLKYIKIPDYSEEGIYMRYNILVDNSHEMIRIAKQKGILLGNWYKNIIDPKGVDLNIVGYKKGSCLSAENYARLSVNLPTYPTMTDSDVSKVIDYIRSFEIEKI